MKLLLDTRAHRVEPLAESDPDLVRGQLLTPLTRNKCWSGEFAIDNGAYSSFNHRGFASLLDRNKQHRDRCLWIAVPDVVGNARRTLEIFERLGPELMAWPLALVAQDGLEDLTVPWDHFECLFIGGTTEWKTSQGVLDLLKTARILSKQTHVGRVNTPGRFRHFRDFADTCDGSGVSRFDWMLDELRGVDCMPLFDRQGGDPP